MRINYRPLQAWAIVAGVAVAGAAQALSTALATWRGHPINTEVMGAPRIDVPSKDFDALTLPLVLDAVRACDLPAGGMAEFGAKRQAMPFDGIVTPLAPSQIAAGSERVSLIEWNGRKRSFTVDLRVQESLGRVGPRMLCVVNASEGQADKVAEGVAAYYGGRATPLAQPMRWRIAPPMGAPTETGVVVMVGTSNVPGQHIQVFTSLYDNCRRDERVGCAFSPGR